MCLLGSVVETEMQVILNMYLKYIAMYFVFCYLDKSNLYFVIEIQLVCILGNWNTFLCEILKVTENSTSAGCIRFNAILGIMFQPVFSVFLCIYHILNSHSHSVNTMPRNMFTFLLFIKWILIDWLIDPQWILNAFCTSITFAKSILYFGLLVRSNWQK